MGRAWAGRGQGVGTVVPYSACHAMPCRAGRVPRPHTSYGIAASHATRWPLSTARISPGRSSYLSGVGVVYLSGVGVVYLSGVGVV